MNFQWPAHLAWLALPALLFFAALLDLKKRHSDLERFAGPRLADRYIPSGLQKRRNIKQGLATAALTLTIIGWAGPRYGKELREVNRRSSDILIGVDVSASMLAEDIVPNRITKAKRELTELIESLRGDRVGLIEFAGAAFLQCPLTTDLDAVTMYLDLLDPTTFPVPGTDIGSALRLAVETLPEGKRSAIVLLTDGEDFGRDTGQAIKEAAGKGIRVYCIGYGTPKGELIKIRDESGKVIGFKKDEKGETVVSRLDESLLSDISRQTRGRYFPASNGDIEVDELAQEIKGLKKETMGTEELSQYEHRFQIPLFLALFCALLELLIPERPVTFRKSAGFSLIKKIAVVMVLLATAAPVKAGFQQDINDGNKQYAVGQWDKALGAYRSAQAEDPRAGTAPYNIGNTYYRIGQFEDALAELSRSTGTLTSDQLKAYAFYNRGNTYARMGQNALAIEEFKKALLLNPSDEDAKFNLEFCRRQPPSQNKPQNKGGKGGGNNQNKNQNNNAGPPNQNNGQESDGNAKNREALSKEDAERLLSAMQEQERQESQSSSRPLPERSPGGKDW